METHTPTAVERFTTIRGKLCRRLEAEGPRYNVARAVDLLILELMTWVISLAVARAERLQQEEACRDDAVAAAGFATAGGDDGADRRGDANAPDAGHRIAGSAAAAAAVGVLVCNGANARTTTTVRADVMPTGVGLDVPIQVARIAIPGARMDFRPRLGGRGKLRGNDEVAAQRLRRFVLDFPFAKIGSRTLGGIVSYSLRFSNDGGLLSVTGLSTGRAACPSNARQPLARYRQTEDRRT